MNELGDLFKIVSEGKKHFEETTLVGKKVKETKAHVKEDLSSLFTQLAALKEDIVVIEESNQEDIINEVSTLIAEETLNETEIRTPKERIEDTNSDVNKYLTGKTFQQPNPDLVSKDIDAIRQKMKFLEQAIGRIAATGPGGGEVNLRWLDDVKRETISDGRWLKYSEADKKFVFDDINPYEVVYNTTEVTTPTYTVNDTDYYIGVNYNGPVTITLPTSADSGRMIIIKDEDGDAEINPITVLGNVDNDAGGFIIQINNGAIQLIYRNGWRIV